MGCEGELGSYTFCLHRKKPASSQDHRELPYMVPCRKTWSCLSLGLTISLLVTPTAYADFMVAGSLGGSAGLLQKNSIIQSLSGASYAFHLTFIPGRSHQSSWAFGGTVRQYKLGYRDLNVSKRATLNAYGVHTGPSIAVGDTLRLQIFAEYYPRVDFSSLAETSVLLNDEVYRYATLQIMRGQSAKGLRFNLLSDKIDQGFNRSNPSRTGLSVVVFQQNLTQEINKIRVSRDELAPNDLYSKTSVAYKLGLVALEIYFAVPL